MWGGCEKLEHAQAVVNAAKAIDDDEIFTRIVNVELVAKESKYHHSCR